MALAGVAVLASASLAFVLLAGLGARRAGSAWERLRVLGGGEDALLDVVSIDAARDVALRAQQVPGVTRAGAFAYAYIVPEGRLEDFYGGIILPLADGALHQLWRPVLTAGRAADPDKVDEVVVNGRYLDISGLRVGDEFPLTDGLGFIRQPVRIVGVGVIPNDFVFAAGAPIAYVTDAFTRRWDGELHTLYETAGADVIGPAVLVAADDRLTTDQLRDRLVASLPPETLTGVTDAKPAAALVVDTLDLQRNGYLAAAVVGGAAAMAMLALVLARVTRLQAAESVALTALGFTPQQLRAAVFAPGALVAAAAGTAAVLLSALGQDVVPEGLAGRIGVGRGLADDLGFLVLGGIGSAAVLLVVLAVAARPAPRVPDAGLSAGGGRSTPWRWPAIGAGLRAATGGLASAGRRQALAAFTGVAVAAVGMAAVGVIVQSRTALRHDLSRVGKFFDVWLYTYADSAAAHSDRDALVAAESVAGVATIEAFRLRAGGVGTAAIVVTPDKGDMGLTMLQGRPADAADELVAAPSLLRQLGAGIGDTVELAGTEEPRRFRIVGSAAFPFASATAAAEQVAITSAGRQSLAISPEGFAIGIDLVDRAVIRGFRAGNDNIDACDTARLEQLLGVEGLAGPASGAVFLCVPRSDQRISNLDELGALPGGVSALLAVLGTAGLAYLLGASFRRARRDLAVLRVLGFSRGQIAVTVLVQAGTVALVGSLVALPFGVALGRLAWRNVAQGIGIVSTPEVSLLGTLGVAAGAVVVAALLAAPFAARTLGRPPAAWLRAE